MAKLKFVSFVDSISKQLEKDKKKALINAGRFAVRKIRKKIDSVGIKTNSRNLKKGIGTKLVDDNNSILVGPGPRAYHAHLLELGTAERRQRKTGKYTGRIKATPFLLPALDEESEKIADILAEGWL